MPSPSSYTACRFVLRWKKATTTGRGSRQTGGLAEAVSAGDDAKRGITKSPGGTGAEGAAKGPERN